jgi:hypothetical protein
MLFKPASVRILGADDYPTPQHGTLPTEYGPDAAKSGTAGHFGIKTPEIAITYQE